MEINLFYNETEVTAARLPRGIRNNNPLNIHIS